MSDVLDAIRKSQQALDVADMSMLQELAERWTYASERLQREFESMSQVILEAKKAGKPVSQNWLYREERYRQLLLNAKQEMQRYASFVEDRIVLQQRRYVTDSQRDADSILRLNEVPFFAILNINAINAMIGLASEGSPLYELLLESWPKSVGALTQALIDGVTLGNHPSKIAKEMVQAGPEGTLRRMLTIARTETLRVYRAGAALRYQQSGMVDSYRRLARKSNRTCFACLIMDGSIYPIDHPFEQHPNCRCTLVPIVTGREPLQWKVGRDWLLAQPETTQRAIFGPGRFEAYRQGVPLEDLVKRREDPRWGASIVPKPVRDIVIPAP